jgi:hypothetical protein
VIIRRVYFLLIMKVNLSNLSAQSEEQDKGTRPALSNGMLFLILSLQVFVF